MSRITLAGLVLCFAVSGCDVFVSPQQRIERAAGLIEKGDYSTASIELRNALGKQPDNAQGRLLLARTELWMGDAPAAEKDVQRALDAGARLADAARLKAEIARALGQYEELASFVAKPQTGLEEYERLMFLGYAQLGSRQFDAARATFDASVAVAGPGLPRAEALSAQAAGMAASGDAQGAMKVLDAVVRQQPGYGPASIAKGKLLLQRGDFADAETVLAELATRADWAKFSVEERMTVLGSLSEARLGQHRLAEAQQSVDQLSALVPDAPIAAYMRGRLALAQGKVPAAVSDLQQAVRDAPGFLPAHIMLGIAYFDGGNAAQAEAEFQKALEAAPDNVEIRKLLAQAQMRQGRADAAAEVLAPALAADSSDPGVYALAGRARLMQGDEQAGDALLERGLAGTPDDSKLRVELAGTYVATGNPQRALELLATVPDEAGGEAKRQVQFLALATGKDKASAKLEVDALVKRNPRDVRLLDIASAWLAYQGDFDGARAYLRQALAIAPKDPRLMVSLGRIEERAGRDIAAGQAYESARAADPKYGDAYIGLAKVAERRGDRAGALRWISEWSKADARATQPRLLLARTAFRDGKIAEGRRLVEEAVSLTPGNASVEGSAGQIYMDAGLYDEALGRFRRAADLDARDPAYLLGAARAQLAMGRSDAARASLRQAMAIRKGWTPAAVLLAQLELRDKNVDAALAVADELKKEPGQTRTGYLLEGDIRLALGQGALAASAYSASTRLQPSAAAAIGESRARRMAGMPQPAAPLASWLAASPDDAEVRLELAQLYQATGALDDAVREYEAVLRARPDALLALNNLAWVYGERGNYERAETLARQARAQAPQSGPVADTLGWILLKAGKVDESVVVLQQAYDLDKKSPEIAYHYGAALLKTGNKEKAVPMLQNAIKTGQGAPWVEDARRLVVESQ